MLGITGAMNDLLSQAVPISVTASGDDDERGGSAVQTLKAALQRPTEALGSSIRVRHLDQDSISLFLHVEH